MSDPPFVVDRSPRGFVLVTGPDATSFLQSIVSQDLEPVEVGASVRSLLLHPQGKLDVAFRARRGEESWSLDTEREYGPRLAAALLRFRIRVAVDIEDRTSSTGMLSLVGQPVDIDEPLVALPTTWGDTRGVDVLGPLDVVENLLHDLDPAVRRASPEEFEAFRIEHGVALLGVDIDDSTIPQEAFLDRDAVSFTKGCFLGQELVTRIDTRGHVNRYLRRLAIEGDALPVAGASAVVDERTVGTVTSAARVTGGLVVALGMVRREVEPGTAVELRWEDGTARAVVDTIP